MARGWIVSVWLAALATYAAAANIDLVSGVPSQGFGGLSRSFAWVSSSNTGGTSCGQCAILDVHKAFDGQTNTKLVTPTNTNQNIKSFELLHYFGYSVKVVRYEIHAVNASKWQPRSWTLKAGKFSAAGTAQNPVVVHKVEDAVFKNGKFVAKLTKPGNYRWFELLVTEDNTPGDGEMTLKIKEIQFSGPKLQYDRKVSGVYPCSSAGRYITKSRRQGGNAFTNSPDNVKKMFDDSNARFTYDFPISGPLIVGYHFKNAVKVIQYAPDRLWFTQSQRRATTLEGHKCNPSCDYLGEQGWKVLASGTHKQNEQKKWLVQKPGSYRAYRVKYAREKVNGDSVQLSELYLLRC